MLSSHTGSARVILGGGCAVVAISTDDGMALIQSRALAHSNLDTRIEYVCLWYEQCYDHDLVL